MRNSERYLAFSPAVPQAFLEVSDLRRQFFLYAFSTSMGNVYCVLSIVLKMVFSTASGTVENPETPKTKIIAA